MRGVFSLREVIVASSESSHEVVKVFQLSDVAHLSGSSVGAKNSPELTMRPRAGA